MTVLFVFFTGCFLLAYIISVFFLFRLPREVPLRERRAAFCQWWRVGIPFSIGVLATPFVAPLVILTAIPVRNKFGEFATRHKQHYIDQGASGNHVYMATPISWLDPWNNLEDGLAGEPSGKHSSRVAGKEYSFSSMLAWLIRNPFNKAKRESRFFACFPNGCDFECWGKEKLSDKNADPLQKGWYFVKATDRETGQVYYGYRSVSNNNNGTVRQVNIGYKIKPSHADQIQDADDLDKAFTLRFQKESEID